MRRNTKNTKTPVLVHGIDVSRCPALKADDLSCSGMLPCESKLCHYKWEKVLKERTELRKRLRNLELLLNRIDAEALKEWRQIYD